MSLTALSVPETTESVVIITVHITLDGDLPPAAALFIRDVESFVNGQGRYQADDAAPLRLTTEIRRDTAKQAGAPQAFGPALRLVGPAGTERDHRPRVRRIDRAGEPGRSLYLHTGSRLVLHRGVPVPFTRREYDLFRFLCENPRRVFSRAQLLRNVWGYDMVGTERTVDVHVRRLRAKLTDCASIITTVRGVGYRFDDDTPVEVVVRQD